MRKTMLARYAGVCADTGVRFRIGDEITYCTITRKAYLMEHDDSERVSIPSDKRYISDVYRFDNGKEIYRNKRGLCIDAPCCGCCTG
jgi:hypothetical protein